MSERNLFEELKQGLEEILLHQQGKITLRTETLSKPEHIAEVLGRYKKGQAGNDQTLIKPFKN